MLQDSLYTSVLHEQSLGQRISSQTMVDSSRRGEVQAPGLESPLVELPCVESLAAYRWKTSTSPSKRISRKRLSRRLSRMLNR